MFREQERKVNMEEEELIRIGYMRLVDEFKALPGLKKVYPIKGPDKGFDAIFQFKTRSIYVEAKQEIRFHQAQALIEMKKQLGIVLVIAEYISPKVKKYLEENEVNYMDQAGNIWFSMPPVYIQIKGNPTDRPSTKRPGRAFSKTGLKLTFSLLVDASLINATYRDIVEKTGVSLGSIPPIFAGLKEEGFLLEKTGGNWMLVEKEDLIHRWEESYVEKLRPRLLAGRFRATNRRFSETWKKMTLIEGDKWGGEPGADLLTNYLRPESYTMYSNQLQVDLMKSYRWVPDPEGNIEVYRPFWKSNFSNQGKVAHPLVIHAELMMQGDERSLETAKVIYEQFLQNL